LESVYKALGVDPKKVFSDVHALAAKTPAPTPSGSAPVPSAAAVPAQTSGFKLDAARIAELQRESQEVSALLANIFVDEEALTQTVSAAEETTSTEAEPIGAAGLMGLDEAHSALARLLLQRPEWSRADLADAASDLEVMLEGALLSINEAAFDAYDIPFTEGDDPIEVNAEILEKLEA
ncbi:MAG: hypothetical protein EON54_20850, partial [Alcaligenaceae bacterium]